MINQPTKKLGDEFSNYLGVFFWNFKRMDNTIYNLEILSYLYSLRKSEKDKALRELLNKPIIIFGVSIVECILYDFMTRIQQHRNEVIPNLPTSVIEDIKYKVKEGVITMKNLSKLNDIIPQLKKHNLLNWNVDGENIYEQLDKLKTIRNKIHIQNTDEKLNRNELYIFTDANVKKLEIVLETVLKAMIAYYPRPRELKLTPDNLPFPWR